VDLLRNSNRFGNTYILFLTIFFISVFIFPILISILRVCECFVTIFVSITAFHSVCWSALIKPMWLLARPCPGRVLLRGRQTGLINRVMENGRCTLLESLVHSLSRRTKFVSMVVRWSEKWSLKNVKLMSLTTGGGSFLVTSRNWRKQVVLLKREKIHSRGSRMSRRRRAATPEVPRRRNAVT
jgi:hypothetical protein